jgi:hypothetical protein
MQHAHQWYSGGVETSSFFCKKSGQTERHIKEIPLMNRTIILPSKTRHNAVHKVTSTVCKLSLSFTFFHQHSADLL